jgi:anaerobic magnesium-protoporphyrin IX monomethyl ester cyclase
MLNAGHGNEYNESGPEAMRAVLLNPPVSARQLYGDWNLSAVDTFSAPLGLLYLAGYARSRGHEVQVIDAPVLKVSPEQAAERVLSLNPDVVGISALTINISCAGLVAEALKKKGLSVPIVVGGPHVSAVPRETLRRYSAFDFGVRGEGEIAFAELLERIGSGGPVSDAGGLVWRDQSGEIRINPPGPAIEDLDRLPLPAWDLLPNFPRAYPNNPLETKRLPAASIITSRGCPHQCTFCDRSVFGSRVRHHSAAYTLGMIRHLRDRYGVRDLMILDDIFLLDRPKLYAICDAMIRERMDLNWYCLAHIRFMTEDRLRKAREAGCWIMEVGIESGCERILRHLKRNMTKVQIAAAVRSARDAGIRVKGNFIFGLPTETRDSLRETTEFAREIDISFFQQNFLTVFPGCELSRDAEKYGFVEKDWERLSLWKISFVPFGLTRADLLKASKTAYRRFYLRPKIVLEILRSVSSLHVLRSLRKALYAFFVSLLRRS